MSGIESESKERSEKALWEFFKGDEKNRPKKAEGYQLIIVKDAHGSYLSCEKIQSDRPVRSTVQYTDVAKLCAEHSITNDSFIRDLQEYSSHWHFPWNRVSKDVI